MLFSRFDPFFCLDFGGYEWWNRKHDSMTQLVAAICVFGESGVFFVPMIALGDRIWKLDTVLRKDWINIPLKTILRVWGKKSFVFSEVQRSVWSPDPPDAPRFSPLSLLSCPVAWEWRWGGGEWEWIPLLATKDIPEPKLQSQTDPPDPRPLDLWAMCQQKHLTFLSGAFLMMFFWTVFF